MREAADLGAEAVLHCGDLVAPSTLNVLKPYGLPIHVKGARAVRERPHRPAARHFPPCAAPRSWGKTRDVYN
ncbi:MAG: hypothetical protein ABR558_11105 [Thioalkalivibrio sp.]